MADASSSYLLQLANQIQVITTQIVESIAKSDTREPSFHANSESIPLTQAHVRLRNELNDTAADLLRLVNGPKTDIHSSICTIYDLAAWQVACEFNLFEAVPQTGCISVQDIARKVGVDGDRVGRIMRILATDRVFVEVDKDMFEHTSRSILYARDQQIHDAVHYQVDEYFRAAPELSNSIRVSPNVNSRSNCAFFTKHGKELFQYYRDDDARASRFGSAMAGFGKLEDQFSDLKESYAWENINEGGLVDIGGGRGHVSIALARSFPNLRVIVQDSVSMISHVDTNALGDLQGRVSFMEHSFFDQQPIVGAAAYLLRLVTHNWDDQNCVRIFKAIVPALEKSPPKTPLLINDIVLPEWGMESSRFEEHRLRQVDIMMMTVLGSKQRTVTEFAELLQQADKRLKIVGVRKGRSGGLLKVCLDRE